MGLELRRQLKYMFKVADQLAGRTDGQTESPTGRRRVE